MRERQEIEKDFQERKVNIRVLQLEVLLDIREVLIRNFIRDHE
jgi:hypothetical protein